MVRMTRRTRHRVYGPPAERKRLRREAAAAAVAGAEVSRRRPQVLAPAYDSSTATRRLMNHTELIIEPSSQPPLQLVEARRRRCERARRMDMVIPQTDRAKIPISNSDNWKEMSGSHPRTLEDSLQHHCFTLSQ
uniref:Uncharacterized protein n=1 Tax=Steinernema glaseri TaxID=37863 RepID=A0A1I8AHH8_9BILA